MQRCVLITERAGRLVMPGWRRWSSTRFSCRNHINILEKKIVFCKLKTVFYKLTYFYLSIIYLYLTIHMQNLFAFTIFGKPLVVKILNIEIFKRSFITLIERNVNLPFYFFTFAKVTSSTNVPVSVFVSKIHSP